VHGRDRGLHLVGADRRGGQRLGDQLGSFGDGRGVPPAAVLLGQRHQPAVGPGAGVAAGSAITSRPARGWRPRVSSIWLAEVPGHCLQQTLIDLDQACARHGTWKVGWKSKVKNAPSFRFPEGGKIAVDTTD
jgi:hypothetical protein